MADNLTGARSEIPVTHGASGGAGQGGLILPPNGQPSISQTLNPDQR